MYIITFLSSTTSPPPTLRCINVGEQEELSPVVLLPWGGEVGCSTRGEGEACPGPVTRYRQRLAPGLGGGPQDQHLVNQKKKYGT